MKIHVIIDFMHIYYKYFFQLSEGKLKHLSAPVDWNGTVIEKDVSLIYYPLKDIEGIRKSLETLGHDVTMSICFDSKSHRQDDGVAGGTEYKANRTKSLNENDFKNIEFINKKLIEAGHNTYKFDGYEADDIASYLVRNYAGSFDYNVIYTNDKDLLVNINEKVGVMRFKQYKGYTQVDMNNYEQYLEPEFKTFIPYNALGLYLSSVGDKADGISGIKGFGPKAFGKLITKVAAKNEIDWKACGDYNKLAEVVVMCEEFLEPTQYEQLQTSFALVANLEIIDDVTFPSSRSTQDLREKAYMPMNMVSLVP